MLHIIWTILKIIGLLILVLLALVLLCVCAVLFVPIRYRANGKKEADSYFVKAECHWLLHLFRIKAVYPEPGRIVAKIFCFTVFDSAKEKTEKKKKVKKVKKAGKAERTKNPKKEAASKDVAKKRLETDKKKTLETKANEPESVKIESKKIENEKEDTPKKGKVQQVLEKVKTIVQHVFDIIKNIRYTIRRFCDKIKEIWTNMQYYVEVFQEEETKRAFLVCKQQLYKIWKNIRPSKCKAQLKLGTGEPDTTGYVLALHGILYPLIGNNIFIEPDFENQVFEGTFSIKGRITIFVLLYAAVKLYFDNDIRYFLKRFKREEVTDGR